MRDQIPFFRRQFGEVASEWKEDDTRVTFADFAISEKVFAELRRDFPGDDYCSEEASPLDEVQRLDALFAWVIDPIDGTNNFALGFPVCAISLALLHEGDPIYGFVYDYGTDTLLEGGPGRGLWRNGRRIERNAKAAQAQTMLGLHFPIEPGILQRIESLLTRYRVRSLGSATLSFTGVASGYLTGAIDYRVRVWDIAAASALCGAVDVEFEFLADTPFPLRTFHARAGRCPCLAGEARFCHETRELLG